MKTQDIRGKRKGQPKSGDGAACKETPGIMGKECGVTTPMGPAQPKALWLWNNKRERLRTAGCTHKGFNSTPHIHTHRQTHTDWVYLQPVFDLTLPLYSQWLRSKQNPNSLQAAAKWLWWKQRGLDGWQALSSCHHLTELLCFIHLWLCYYVIMIWLQWTCNLKICPASCLWFVLKCKRMHHAERLKDLNCCECSQQSCHLWQWRHEVTTTSRVAFWQTQPAIFTSVQELSQPIRAERPSLNTLITCIQLPLPLRGSEWRGKGKKEQEWMVCLRQRVICVES